MPRNLYAPNCQHRLYDAGCGLIKSAHGTSGTVGSGSTAYAINWSGSSAVYAQGTITFSSGVNAGVTANVKSATPSALSLSYALPSAPSTGDAFAAYQGCDHTQSTCQNKFGNLANFRGITHTCLRQPLRSDDADRIARTWAGRRRGPQNGSARPTTTAPTCAAPGSIAECFSCAFSPIRASLSPSILRPYPPDWHLHRSAERYLDWLFDRTGEVETPGLGDVIVFKYGRTFSHGAIVPPGLIRSRSFMPSNPTGGVRHGYLRHLAAVIRPQPEILK